MKKYFLLLIILIVGLFSIACSKQDVEDEPQFLDVQLTANPKKVNPNEEITFEAKVTYGEEKVMDAEEVKFEIWRANADQHEKIMIEHSENGIYRLKKSFAEEGTYYIISHVTARSMHNMPKVEFVVGNPSEPEEKMDTGTDMDGQMDDQMEGQMDDQEENKH